MGNLAKHWRFPGPPSKNTVPSGMVPPSGTVLPARAKIFLERDNFLKILGYFLEDTFSEKVLTAEKQLCYINQRSFDHAEDSRCRMA